ARPPEARTGACGVARRCARISATLSIGSQPSQIPPPTLWQARCNRPVSILTEGLMKTRIVIVGGGFAGLYAAMYLDKTVAPRSEAEVMLISRENFIVFTPMLHEVAAGDLHPGDIVNPLRRILRHVNVVQAEVDAIDLRARTVSCVAGLRDVRREFEFDPPLLALGSEPDFFETGRGPRLDANHEKPERRRPAPQHNGRPVGDGGVATGRSRSSSVADVRHCWRWLCRRGNDGRRQRFHP